MSYTRLISLVENMKSGETIEIRGYTIAYYTDNSSYHWYTISDGDDLVVLPTPTSVLEYINDDESMEELPKNDVGTKNDNGKTRWSLVFWPAVEDMVRALQIGVDKYGEKNYMKGLEPQRIMDAMMRHIVAIMNGEWIDESGNSHVGHVMANAMMLYEQRSSEDKNEA